MTNPAFDSGATRALSPRPVRSAAAASPEKSSSHGSPDAIAEVLASDPHRLELHRADLNRTDLSGFRFGPYKPGRKLGQGGMGQVFAATHEALGKTFAIKFPSSQLPPSEEATARFLDEASSLGRLQHPNIVSAVDAGFRNGLHYLVTEFISGQDLARHMASQGPMPEQQALEIIRQVASGLAWAHQNGFVHRDIKPSNLIVDEHDIVRILDFGLARHAQSSHGLTADGQLLGTVDFLAPEQAANAQSVDARSDLYSLGCTLIFLLTGAPPFPNSTHPNFATKIHAHLFEVPAILSDKSSTLSPPVRRLLNRLMMKRPEDRPASATDVVADIRTILQEGNSRSGSDENLPADTRSRIASDTPIMETTHRAHQTSRRTLLVTSRAVLAAGIVAVISAASIPDGPAVFPSAPDRSVAAAASVRESSSPNTGSLRISASSGSREIPGLTAQADQEGSATWTVETSRVTNALGVPKGFSRKTLVGTLRKQPSRFGDSP